MSMFILDLILLEYVCTNYVENNKNEGRVIDFCRINCDY